MKDRVLECVLGKPNIKQKVRKGCPWEATY